MLLRALLWDATLAPAAFGQAGTFQSQQDRFAPATSRACR
jgi:hypothetical protein